MPKICNISSDLIKNITGACIVPVGQISAYLEDILQGTPVMEILKHIKEKEQDANILEITLLPDDITLNSKQKDSSAGFYVSHSYNITVQPNQLQIHGHLKNFFNKKVLLFLQAAGDPVENYLIGANEQGLTFFIEEYTTYFVISLSGDTYFSALRT